jgi:hypothetical protein
MQGQRLGERGRRRSRQARPQAALAARSAGSGCAAHCVGQAHDGQSHDAAATDVCSPTARTACRQPLPFFLRRHSAAVFRRCRYSSFRCLGLARCRRRCSHWVGPSAAQHQPPPSAQEPRQRVPSLLAASLVHSAPATSAALRQRARRDPLRAPPLHSCLRLIGCLRLHPLRELQRRRFRPASRALMIVEALLDRLPTARLRPTSTQPSPRAPTSAASSNRLHPAPAPRSLTTCFPPAAAHLRSCRCRVSSCTPESTCGCSATYRSARPSPAERRRGEAELDTCKHEGHRSVLQQRNSAPRPSRAVQRREVGHGSGGHTWLAT